MEPRIVLSLDHDAVVVLAAALIIALLDAAEHGNTEAFDAYRDLGERLAAAVADTGVTQ